MFPGGVIVNSNSNELGSVTGRLGYSFGPALLYAKGGYAFKDSDNVLVAGSPFGVATTGNTRDGYTVGAGLEYMFAPNWSAKIEYQYYNFGSTTFLSPVALAGARFNDDEHTVKAGMNYRFNWGGPVRPLLIVSDRNRRKGRPRAGLFRLSCAKIAQRANFLILLTGYHDTPPDFT